jgi:hypothetical protein
MAKTQYIYRRTAAGQSAWDIGGEGLTPALRRMLGLLQADTHSDVLHRLLRQHTELAVLEWASQLERLGLIESLPGLAEHDLDFSGSFSFPGTR